MRIVITSQQALFFKEHGFIEFDTSFLKPESIFTAIEMCAEKKKNLFGRDLWRKEPILEKLATKTLAPLVLNLANKSPLRLALDQWIPKNLLWKEPLAVKELFAIQGITLIVIFSNYSAENMQQPKVGILPLPTHAGHCLIVRPHILLDWPKLSSLPDDAFIYLIGYGNPELVYIQNLKDPGIYELKQLGYHFGDSLRVDTHPLIR